MNKSNLIQRSLPRRFLCRDHEESYNYEDSHHQGEIRPLLPENVISLVTIKTRWDNDSLSDLFSIQKDVNTLIINHIPTKFVQSCPELS